MTQEAALSIMKQGHNVFLSGAPGAGKTYVLNQYISYLNDHGIELAVTAPTGIAASHIGGTTIHSFFGIGIKEQLNQYDLENLTEKKYIWDRLKNLKVLIIDEVSMLSPDLFTSIDAILKTFKFSQEPFGGVQVIVTGDFFQLPPVSRNESTQRFIFETQTWDDLNPYICYLEGSHRHEDEVLLNILNEIRSNSVSEESMDLFRSRYRKKTLVDGAVTKLYTHNTDVDSINQQELNSIDEPLKVYEAHTTGQKKWIERIFSTSLFLPRLELKKGALVFFIKNNYEAGYINGTLGTIIDFDRLDNPIVETVDGREIVAHRIEWSYTDGEGVVKATIKQVPLRLAWAITIHKSQGMTLDAAEIDLSKAFEPGQGYVALSRIRSLEGLTLMGLNDTALSVDPKVLHVDLNMKETSTVLHEQLQETSEEIIKERYQRFLSRIGGSLEKGNKKKEEEAQANEPKTPTTELTKELLESGMTIEEIAEERDLKENTIANHIEILITQYPDLDISHIQPPSKIIDLVEDAVEKIKNRKHSDDLDEQGKIKLKPIFQELNEEIDYKDIRLALLFLE